jgi:hypothetical protein
MENEMELTQITAAFTPDEYFPLARSGKRTAKDFLQDVLQEILKDGDRQAEIKKLKDGTFAVFANMPFVLDAEGKYRKENENV